METGVSMKFVASHGPFVLSWTQAHRRGGQALNPIQAGFLFIQRQPAVIPLKLDRESVSIFHFVNAPPCLHRAYPIEGTGVTVAEDSLR